MVKRLQENVGVYLTVEPRPNSGISSCRGLQLHRWRLDLHPLAIRGSREAAEQLLGESQP